MASRRVIQQVIYHDEKDILFLSLAPGRPSVTSGNEFDFFILYDWDNRDDIVGFEIHDFADFFIPHLYELGAVPDMDMTFDVQGTEIKDAPLRDVLEWAYRRYVRKKAEAATSGAL